MSCQAFIEQIIEQSGRQEPAPELAAHLAACASCARLSREQRALWSTMDAWEAPDVSPGFDRRLYARVGRRVTGPFGSLDWLMGLLRPTQPALATALACMLIIATMVVGRQRYAPAPPQNAAVAIHAHERDDPQQIQLALDDIQMLSDFDILPVGQGDSGRT